MSLIDAIFGKTEEETKTIVSIPVLCKLWQEDGVWNGEAAHLAVAVFGESFEDTRHNLRIAIISHLQTLQDVGRLEETIPVLQACAKQRFVLDEIPNNEAVCRLTAGVEDHRVVCIA